MALRFPTESVAGFRIELTQDGKACTLKCSGSLDAWDSVTTLQPELLKFHEQLIAEQTERVVVDLQVVEYMNSSGIKSFVTWFLKAAQVSEPRYQIELRYDPRRTWQYVSFATLARVAPNVLKTIPIAKAAK